MPVSLKKSFNILIVDDEGLVCWSLSKALEEDGYTVSTAQSGEEALALLTRKSFDIVITDLRLPRISGMELLREIKKELPQCKILMISAYGTPQVRQEAIKDGAIRFIDKPFDIKDIKESVRSALSL